MPMYNRTAAANYASVWALHRNPMWVDDSSSAGGGGDCTNFVSQALFAGGWPMIKAGLAPNGSIRTGPYWWAEMFNHNRRQRSKSWGSAEQFRHFLEHSGRARPCYPPEMKVGDLMQYILPGYEHASHTMMVTKVVQGRIHLSYHSSDNLNISLDDLLKKVGTGTRFLNWKVYDYFWA
jgi:hypothetical protein